MNSIREMLEQEVEAIDLLECFYGLSECEKRAFGLLAEQRRWLTVDEVAERIDRERSTTYRAIKRLHREGLVEQTQVNYEQGGYCYVYGPADPATLAQEMQRVLNSQHAHLDRLVEEFRQQCDPERGRCGLVNKSSGTAGSPDGNTPPPRF